MIRIPFFSRRASLVEALYGNIVAVARRAEAYRDFGVRDTFEGRFERLALVMTLVLRRMKALPMPAHERAQELVDRFFADLDDSLRRAGISDLSVGKKAKAFARGFYGRAEAYTEALASGDEAALRAALARNLYEGALEPADIAPQALEEISGLVAALDAADLALLLSGTAMPATLPAERT